MIIAGLEKDIDQQAKLLLNKITPDNFESIKSQILEIYKNALTESDKNIFIKVFFKKACHEEKYTGLYINLIKFISTEITKFEN